MDTPVLKRVTRLDSVPVTEAFYTEEGYLKDQPILTSTGIFEYANPDGSIRRELRLPEDVFDPDSLASYEGKPIIITHDAGLVDKDNVADNQIGTILTKGMRSGDDVKAKIIIHNTDEMKRRGLKELSLGYNLDLDEEPGVWNGQRYDAIQRNIRINHLALVREARAGDQARLNIDSKDGTTLKGGKLMSKVIRKRGRRSDEALSPEELQKAIEWYKKNRGSFESDEEEVEIEEKPVEKLEKKPAEKPVEKEAEKKAASIEEQIGNIRENHPVEKDSEDKAPFVLPAKPEKKEEAKEEEEEVFDAEEVIKDQDKDIKTLLDIIDTLLAERAFDEAEEVPEEEKKVKIVEEVENEDEDDEEFIEDEDEELELQEGEEEEFVVDADEEEEEVIIEEENEDEECGFGEEEKKLNTDSIDKIVRTRVKLGMIGKMLNLDGLEDVGIKTAKKAIIKTVRPKVNLDGKSNAYINAMFDCAVEDIKKNTRKDTNYQRRQMFNKDSAKVGKDEDSSVSARDRMIKRHRNKEGK